MKCFITVFLLGILLASCGQVRDVKKLQLVFSQTDYDKDIIKSLPLYDSLKNIIISNIDTIFRFRNSRHFVFHGDTGKETQEDADSYQFYYNYGEATSLSSDAGPNGQELVDAVSVENMPAFIYPSVDSVFKKLGKSKIRGFTLWTDSTIAISIKTFGEGEVDVGHTLTWKRIFAKSSEPDLFYKDTVIAPKWTYGIWVSEHQGW
jgi:hypothetical protein